MQQNITLSVSVKLRKAWVFLQHSRNRGVEGHYAFFGLHSVVISCSMCCFETVGPSEDNVQINFL